MKRQLVYDLPTRLFHWIFAGLFLTAFIIAKTIDNDSGWFNFHSLAGLTLGFLVLLRIIWGFIGTQHARFTDFAMNPKDLIHYFKDIFSGQKTRWSGHNPASSWAAILMMFLALGLAVTGNLMTSSPNKESFEDIHELFANGFIVIVILHVSGIVLHSFRFKEMIALSMLDGKKDEVPVGQNIQKTKFGIGILFICFVVSFGLYLFKNYDTQTRSLQFFGTALQLGDSQSGESQKDD